MIITDPVHADLRSAINIKRALDIIYRLRQLGYCPTKVQKFRDNFQLDERGDSEDGSEEDGPTSKDLANQVCKYGRKKRSAPNGLSRLLQAIFNELGTVYKDMKDLSVSHACGKFKLPSFHLCISPGCEYNASVMPYSKLIDLLLPGWFEHSAISGYGDLQSLETKVDSEVRNAREIPASEFQVKPEFLERIQKLWREHFLPRNVRAAPAI